MVSPELLRRYPFFGSFNEAQLAQIAMYSEEVSAQAGEALLNEGDSASTLYFLLTGSVDLFNTIQSAGRPGEIRELSVGEVNPGEPLGISSLVEPYILTTTARASSACRLVKMDAQALRLASEKDCVFGLLLMRAISRAMLERLNAIRIQLAAAWA